MVNVQDVTLQYYNDHAREFTEQTQHVNFAETQQEFIKHLQQGSLILDFGCGAGRDSAYFISQGYKVVALEGAEQLALLAEKFIKQKVLRQTFEQFCEIDCYDGVWACASLLHLPWDILCQVVQNLSASLHRKGIFYASFKYGNFAGMRHGRYFTDMTEERWQSLTEDFTELNTIKMWVTGDVREGRSKERWLNILCQKQ